MAVASGKRHFVGGIVRGVLMHLSYFYCNISSNKIELWRLTQSAPTWIILYLGRLNSH